MSTVNGDSFGIQTFGLTKGFWQRKGFFKKARITALDNVSIEINKGQIFGLLGPNGAGKTTLIKILSTLISPDRGNALVNGYPLKDQIRIKSCIGLIVNNERSFYGRLTGRQNLEFYGTLHNLPWWLLRKRMDELLAFVGLNKVADIWYQYYSTGMKQRLTIARGLLHNPNILLMDEPTKGLDPKATQQLLDFVKTKLSHEQNKTIVITTHLIHEAEMICNKIAIMDEGKIKYCALTQEILSQEGSIYNLFMRLTNKKNGSFYL